MNPFSYECAKAVSHKIQRLMRRHPGEHLIVAHLQAPCRDRYRGLGLGGHYVELVEFGANGVRLDHIEDEYQLSRETRRIDGELCFIGFVGFNGGIAALAYAVQANPSLTDSPWALMGLAGAPIAFLIAAFVGFFAEEKKRRAPVADETFDHISGFGAFVGLALLGVILGAAVLGQMNYPDFVVPEEFGIAAIAALAIGFVMIALLPKALDPAALAGVVALLRWLTLPLNPLGRAISAVDAWLVYSVAPTVGCTLKSTPARYTVLTLHLLCSTILAWLCPAPLGLVGTSWAVIAAIATARRWAWSETEREKLLQDKSLKQSQLRVSTEIDLRDEALWALILLVIVMPVGLRQFYMTTGVVTSFSLDGPVRDDPFAWFGFFGVELLKALPFVDWADIYGAHGLTRISANSPLALHAVFAARVLIDLVFIGALVQAVLVSVALSRHKRRFLNEKVHALDERVEKSELSRLARKSKGEWTFKPEIKFYAHYDAHRLSKLRMRAVKGTRLHATVLELFKRQQLVYEPPGQQLVEFAKQPKADREALSAAIELVQREEHLDLEYLAAARVSLNGKGDIEDIRQRVVQLIIKLPPSPERDAELLNVIFGGDVDSLAAIRILAAQALSRVARNNTEIISALIHVAEHDRAGPVRRKVAALIKSRQLRIGTAKSKKRAA